MLPNLAGLASKDAISTLESIAKIFDSASKFAAFFVWIGELCTTVYYWCIKYLHRQPGSRERTPGVAETGVALTTLDEDGHPRTVQFRVDSWEEERENVRHVMEENRQLRALVEDHGRAIRDLRQQMQALRQGPREDDGGRQLRAPPARRN